MYHHNKNKQIVDLSSKEPQELTASVGFFEGDKVGFEVGDTVGLDVGLLLGDTVGSDVGLSLGDDVGSGVHMPSSSQALVQ